MKFSSPPTSRSHLLRNSRSGASSTLCDSHPAQAHLVPPSFVFRKPGPGHHISLPSPRRDCCCARSQGPDSWPIHCWHGDNVTRPRSWPLTGTSAQADTVLRRRPCTRLLQQFLDYFENPLELACGVKVAQLCPTL